jgi:hypothetical protein
VGVAVDGVRTFGFCYPSVVVVDVVVVTTIIIIIIITVAAAVLVFTVTRVVPE